MKKEEKKEVKKQIWTGAIQKERTPDTEGKEKEQKNKESGMMLVLRKIWRI
jgi:hypothetical protein